MAKTKTKKNRSRKTKRNKPKKNNSNNNNNINNSSNNSNNSNRNKTNTKNKIILKQISESDYPQCCICEEPITYDKALIPRACPYGSDRQHRICPDCWWRGKNGKIAFANENASHHCPGCEKQWPLSNYKSSTTQIKNTDIIDLDSE